LLRTFSALAGGFALVGAYDDTGRAIREGDPRADVARRDAIFRRTLALADLLAAAGAVLLSVAVLSGLTLRLLALLSLPLVVLAGKLLGLYDRDELLINRATLDEAPQLLQLATLYALVFSVLQGPFVGGRLDPGAVLMLWGATFTFALLGRAGGRCLARLATPAERCLFVGSDASALRLRAKLETGGGRALLVGRMSISGLEPQDVGIAASTLRDLVEELSVHRVVIEPSNEQPQTTLDFVREAKGIGAPVSLLPRILEVVGSSIEVDDVHGLTLLGVRRFGLSRSSALVKRGFDVLGALAAIVLFAPLMALAALLIKLDSPGPVIYKQTRVGRDGAPFSIWKFRTMIDGADGMKASLRELNEADGLFKIAADPRVTRPGAWLRRYSLDELPQLVNVLRGEMSLVGPRPLVLDDDAQITGLDRRRLQLTPGMTGPWQILGSARVPLAEMIKLDYLYVTGWSLWSDVKILLRTVPYVLACRGM
jgi:exopolysaccharide biosynthesis polyprenyl glycosylphosphotransferase